MSIQDTTMLVKVSANENNNKFYEVKLHTDGTVERRWGRVGADGQRKVTSGGRYDYQKVVDEKQRRGYVKFDSTDQPTVATVANLASVARKRIMTDQASKQLAADIDAWCASNRHQIESVSGGQIQVATSGQVTTALGPVSTAQVAEARSLLTTISTNPVNLTRSVERYLTLIPQDIGRKRGWVDEFREQKTIVRQAAFLDTLDGAASMAASMADGSDSGNDDAHFRYTLTEVDPSHPDFDEVSKRYAKSINTMHTSASMKIQRVYEVGCTDDEHLDRWRAEAAEHGNVRRLWHGTGTHNLVSIMHRGFVVPGRSSHSTISITGRMFGDGVYFSDQSSKALNYSAGYWSGQRHSTATMFLADVVMGKEYRPTTTGGVPVTQRGNYQSINVKGGPGMLVRNNEMIQWDIDRIRVKYLAVFGS